MDKSVEDGVCECGLANGFMPACDRQLTGDNRGVVAVPVVEYFEQFAPSGISNRADAPVVEHEYGRLGQVSQKFGVGTIGPGNGEFLKETAQPVVCAP